MYRSYRRINLVLFSVFFVLFTVFFTRSEAIWARIVTAQILLLDSGAHLLELLPLGYILKRKEPGENSELKISCQEQKHSIQPTEAIYTILPRITSTIRYILQPVRFHSPIASSLSILSTEER